MDLHSTRQFDGSEGQSESSKSLNYRECNIGRNCNRLRYCQSFTEFEALVRHGKNREKKWSGAGSNRRHMDFQSIALPTELPDLIGINHRRFIGKLKPSEQPIRLVNARY